MQSFTSATAWEARVRQLRAAGFVLDMFAVVAGSSLVTYVVPTCGR